MEAPQTDLNWHGIGHSCQFPKKSLVQDCKDSMFSEEMDLFQSGCSSQEFFAQCHKCLSTWTRGNMWRERILKGAASCFKNVGNKEIVKPEEVKKAEEACSKQL